MKHARMSNVHMTCPQPPTQHNHKGLTLCSRCHLVWALVALQWVPARTPTVHWGPDNGEAVGGPTPTPQMAKSRCNDASPKHSKTPVFRQTSCVKRVHTLCRRSSVQERRTGNLGSSCHFSQTVHCLRLHRGFGIFLLLFITWWYAAQRMDHHASTRWLVEGDSRPSAAIRAMAAQTVCGPSGRSSRPPRRASAAPATTPSSSWSDQLFSDCPSFHREKRKKQNLEELCKKVSTLCIDNCGEYHEFLIKFSARVFIAMSRREA